MSDQVHLDELIAQQADEMGIRLLKTFAAMGKEGCGSANDRASQRSQ